MEGKSSFVVESSMDSCCSMQQSFKVHSLQESRKCQNKAIVVNVPERKLCKLRISLYTDTLILSLRMAAPHVQSHLPMDLPPARLLCEICEKQDSMEEWATIIHFHIPDSKS